MNERDKKILIDMATTLYNNRIIDYATLLEVIDSLGQQEQDNWISYDEASLLLGLKKSTIRTMACKGKLKKCRNKFGKVGLNRKDF